MTLYTENEETIITAAMSLAAVCDYAISQDGCGYNGRDTEFMHSVVDQHNAGRHLSQKQLRAMYKTLRTYKKQLINFGIEYANLTEPEVTQTGPIHEIDPTWLDFKVNFGKYKGRSIGDIYKAFPDYVKWLSEESFMDDVKAAAGYVIAGKPIPKPEAPKPVDAVLGDFKITFGKYSGKTMGDIWVSDSQYIKWLAEEARMPDVKKNAKAIVDNDPTVIKEIKKKVATKKKLIKMSNAVKSDSGFTMPDEFGRGKTLYDYQLVGAEFLELNDGCGLVGDTVGLGKSAQALSYLQNHPELRPAIIVAPASVKYQWYEYCYSWLKTDDLVEIINGTKESDIIGDIIILNYDILKKNTAQLKKLNPQVIIFDEFHKIKNYKAQRTKAAVELVMTTDDNLNTTIDIPHRIMLSGTPFFNRTNELWVPLTILDPEHYNRRTFHHWHKKYCDAKETQWGWDFSGNSNTEELAKELSHLMIRRTEEDVFDDLPTMTRTVVPITISNRHTYNKAKEDHIAWIREEQGREAAERAGRAEHLTRIEYLKQLVAEGKIKYAIEWIKTWLLSEDKLVIFTNHKKITDALMKEFGKIAVKIDGSTPSGQARLDIANSFETDPNIKLFIGNMIAAAEGLNLGASKAVVFLEMGWSPKLHEQCEGRIKGLRQKGRGRKGLHSFYLVGYDTIDVEIAAMLEAKRNVADTAMQDKVRMNFNFFANLVK